MRKRTRRKHYALVNPITYAIEGACVATGPALDKLRLLELAAIESFAKGRATLTEWRDMNDMLNLAETMSRHGIGVEVLEACAKVQQVLIESAKRYQSTGKMGITGPGLQALRELYEYHDLQRTSISRAEYERMIGITTNRIKGRAPEVVEIK